MPVAVCADRLCVDLFSSTRGVASADVCTANKPLFMTWYEPQVMTEPVLSKPGQKWGQVASRPPGYACVTAIVCMLGWHCDWHLKAEGGAD